MKEVTAMHAGADIQELASDQTSARGHMSVEDLLMLTDSSEDTAAGSKDTRREEQSKERHASGNQERNANRDITVDTGDRQERLQDLKQDRAGRQEHADENLEGAERQASEDSGSEAVKEAQVCLILPGCHAAYSRRVGGAAPDLLEEG